MLDDPEGKIGMQPVNARTLNGVSLDGCAVGKIDGKNRSLESEEDRAKAAKFWEEKKRQAGVI